MGYVMDKHMDQGKSAVARYGVWQGNGLCKQITKQTIGVNINSFFKKKSLKFKARSTN